MMFAERTIKIVLGVLNVVAFFVIVGVVAKLASYAIQFGWDLIP